MDWWTAVLNSPVFDKSFAAVVVLLLFRYMREDALRVVDALDKLRQAVEHAELERRASEAELRKAFNDLAVMLSRRRSS